MGSSISLLIPPRKNFCSLIVWVSPDYVLRTLPFLLGESPLWSWDEGWWVKPLAKHYESLTFHCRYRVSSLLEFVLSITFTLKDWRFFDGREDDVIVRTDRLKFSFHTEHIRWKGRTGRSIATQAYQHVVDPSVGTRLWLKWVSRSQIVFTWWGQTDLWIVLLT